MKIWLLTSFVILPVIYLSYLFVGEMEFVKNLYASLSTDAIILLLLVGYVALIRTGCNVYFYYCKSAYLSRIIGTLKYLDPACDVRHNNNNQYKVTLHDSHGQVKAVLLFTLYRNHSVLVDLECEDGYAIRIDSCFKGTLPYQLKYLMKWQQVFSHLKSRDVKCQIKTLNKNTMVMQIGEHEVVVTEAERKNYELCILSPYSSSLSLRGTPLYLSQKISEFL